MESSDRSTRVPCPYLPKPSPCWPRLEREACKAALGDHGMYLRAFANGNLRVTFKRAALVERMNAIWARRHGAALTDVRHRC